VRSYQQFFAELKRRRVFRVMAMYGVVAFIVLQVADLVFPILELPDWTLQLVLMLTLLGFPVAIVLAWALEATDEGIRRAVPATSEELGGIIRAPASERLPSGLMALVGVTALALGAYWVGTRTAADSGSTSADARLAFADLADDPRPSIAVLPFADMSPDRDQEYFSDGMTEEILNVLAKIRELRVSARTSAFAFRDSDLTAEQLGDTLHVTYVVEGSVRKSGDRLRITAQLIDTGDGSHLWSEQYDRDMDDVFAIQTEIAEAIAEELRVPLGLNQPRQLVAPTQDLEAYELYLAGRARMRERGESLAEAVRLFEAAVARDSSWAPAWAGLAESLELIAYYTEAWEEAPDDRPGQLVIEREFHAESERAARRALALDPDNASAHVALGSVLRNRLEWSDSEASYVRALALDPDNAEAHQQYANLLRFMGRETESLRFARHAVAVDRAPVRLQELSVSLLQNNDNAEALSTVREASSLDVVGGVATLSQVEQLVLANARDFDALRTLAIEDGVPTEVVDLVIEAMRAGSTDGLPAELEAELLSADPFSAINLGRPDLAAGLLLQTASMDPIIALQILWVPLFDPIREHPDYLEMMHLLNLEGAVPQRLAP
jgi:TolB-like protein